MKKSIMRLMLLLISIIPLHSYSQENVSTSTTTTKTDEVVKISRADLEAASPGLLKDLESKYGPSLGVNPDQKHQRQLKNTAIDVATGVDKALGSITDNSNKMANNWIGKALLIIIGYKVMGHSVGIIGVLFPAFLLGFILLIVLWKKRCLPRKIVLPINDADDAKNITSENAETDRVIDVNYDGPGKLLTEKIVYPDGGWQIVVGIILFLYLCLWNGCVFTSSAKQSQTTQQTTK